MQNLVHALKLKVTSLLKKTSKVSGGFTLIELLVVIAIMAVLAGATIVSTNNAREKGRDSKRKEELKSISSALVSYYSDKGYYPPSNNINPIQLDFSSDAPDPWIPELNDYLPKIPRDPLQASRVVQLASTVKNSIESIFSTATNPNAVVQEVNAQSTCPPSGPCQITGTIDDPDGLDDGTRDKSTGNVDKHKKGNRVGRKTTCTEPTEVFLRFTLNKGLTKNRHITSAQINFNPRIEAQDDANYNASDPSKVKTSIYAEKSFDPGPIADNDDWNRRKANKTTEKSWDNIGAWTSVNDIDAAYGDTPSEELSAVLQELIDSYPEGTSFHIIMFWENKAPVTDCAGRTPDSSDGDDDDAEPPVLIINTDDPPTTPTCSPVSHQAVYTGQTASFFANGGNGTYSWTATNGTILNGSGNTPNLQVSYGSSGNYNVRVTSNGLPSANCTVQVLDLTGESGTDPGGGSYGTQCNYKSNIYCYRISTDQKHFILWAQLENLNDPESLNIDTDAWGVSATCKATRPTGSFLNWCIESPK